MNAFLRSTSVVDWQHPDVMTLAEAQFVPPVEKLAFAPKVTGEADLPEIGPNPLPVVVDTIRAHTAADRLGENRPDLVLWTHRA